MRNVTIAALLAAVLALPASASQVDPDQVTLGALSQQAETILRARAVVVDGRSYLQPLEILAGGFDGALLEAFTAPVGVEVSPGQSGLLFLAAVPGRGFRVLGGEHGWIADDPEAERHLRALLEAGPAGGQARFQVFVVGLGAGSPRVRQDGLRDVGRCTEQLRGLDETAALYLREQAVRGLELPDPVPACRLLAHLPGRLGHDELVAATLAGVRPAELGPLVGGQPLLVDRLLGLLADSQEARQRLNLIEVLGHSGSGQAAPGLLPFLQRADTELAAARALGRLAPAVAVKPLKRLLLQGEAGPAAAAWAAVGLAYAGGDEALGALEFALYNHPVPQLRRFIGRLLADPPQARADLAADVWFR